MKKKISILLLVFVFLMTLNISALASETTNTANGFYNIEFVDNVTITPRAGETDVTPVNQDVDGDGNADTWYPKSDRMTVSYNAASEGGYYGLIMVEGEDLPTVDNAIFYVDQITAESNVIEFDVYPILPDDNTVLTLYISSNVDDFELIEVKLNYVVDVEFEADDTPDYIIGDVDGNGKVNSLDRTTLARHVAEWDGYSADDIVYDAADVDANGKVNSLDRTTLARYVAEWDGYESLPHIN